MLLPYDRASLTRDRLIIDDAPADHEGQGTNDHQGHAPVIHKGDQEAKGEADDVLTGGAEGGRGFG